MRGKSEQNNKLWGTSVGHALVGFSFSRFPDYGHHHSGHAINDRKLHANVMVLIIYRLSVSHDLECRSTNTGSYKKLNRKALILSQADLVICRDIGIKLS